MLSTLILSLTTIFAPWHDYFADSRVAETVVMSIHLLALLIGGGLAVTTDREILRTLRNRTQLGAELLERLHRTHRTVIVALTLSFLSGLALATADIESFSKSPVFAIKLGLVALLVINGGLLALAERHLQRNPEPEMAETLWGRIRLTARFSLVLWSCTVIAGVTLVNTA